MSVGKNTDAATCIDGIAAAARSPRVVIAYGHLDATIEVWDCQRGRMISRFQGVHDFGGSRLAMSPDGKRVVAAAYDKLGVRCYDADSGREVWRSPRWTGCQRVGISHDAKRVVASFEWSGARFLDARNGQLVLRSPTAIAAYPSPCTNHSIELRDRIILCSPNRDIAQLGEMRILHAVAFSKSLVLCSPTNLNPWQDTNHVLCASLKSGRERWRFEVEDGGGFLGLACSRKKGAVLAIQYAPERGVFHRAYWLNEQTGTMLRSVDLQCPEPSLRYVIVRDASRVIFDTGYVVDTTNGRVIGHLEFRK